MIIIIIIINKRIIKGTGGLGGWRMSRDHPNYSMIENGRNTEKSPGDLRRPAVTQTLVTNYQLKLREKNSLWVNNNVL